MFVISLDLVLGIYPDREVQMVSLFTKEVKILDKYLDFINVFSEEKVLVLPKHTKLHKHAIILEDCKDPAYGPIYSLDPVKLETMKTYIELQLKTGFI